MGNRQRDVKRTKRNGLIILNAKKRGRPSNFELDVSAAMDKILIDNQNAVREILDRTWLYGSCSYIVNNDGKIEIIDQ